MRTKQTGHKTESISTVEATCAQWANWLHGRGIRSEADIHRGVRAAMQAMAQRKSQAEIAEAAIAAASERDVAPTDARPATSDWRAWVAQKFGGSKERIEAIVDDIAQVQSQGADAQLVVRTAAGAASRWDACQAANANGDSAPKADADAEPPSLQGTMAFCIATVLFLLVALVASSELHSRALSWLVVAALGIAIWMRPKLLQLDEAPPRTRALLAFAVVWIAVLVMPNKELAQLLLVLAAMAAMAIRIVFHRSAARPATPDRSGIEASPDNKPEPASESGMADGDAVAPPPVTPASTGVVAGLLFRKVPMVAVEATGRTRPVYVDSTVVSFVVRRQGTSASGRPFPAIQVQWQGWQLDAPLVEGDTVVFHQTPQDSEINTPDSLYNLTTKTRLSMRRFDDDPEVIRARSRAGNIWVASILLTVVLFLGVAMAMFAMARR